MWRGDVWHIGTNIFVKLGFSIVRLRRKELLYPEEGTAGSSKLFGSIYQTSCSHIPWLYSQEIEVPITYHMPRFNKHKCQGCRTAHRIPQNICIKFHFTKHMGMAPLWTCPALRTYSCCVFRCHTNRRICI